jgi:hypothetical protein
VKQARESLLFGFEFLSTPPPPWSVLELSEQFEHLGTE